jgi:hypothetical protein
MGESLLVDGMHDVRSWDRPLNTLAGLQFSGRFSPLATPPISLLDNLYEVADLPVWGEVYTLQGKAGTRAEAEFQRNTLQSLPMVWDDDACGSAAPASGPDAQACPAIGSTEGATSAILSGNYGAGRTLLYGFNLMANFGAVAIPNPLWQDLARRSFTWLTQITPDASAPVVTGSAVLRRTSIHNGGQDATVVVTATLPVGAKVLSTLPVGQVTLNAAGDQVTWQLAVAGGADAVFDLNLQVPAVKGNHLLRYQVSTLKDGVLTPAGSNDVTLQVADLSTFGAAASAAVQAIPEASRARSDALALIARARASISATAYTRALREAATAQARLERTGESGAQAQKALARLVRAIERKM